jgi:DNA-directed RNA polymerase specialized sigma24 family protein
VLRVGHHLGALEPDKASTLLLHQAFGYSLKEIARMMNVSIAAAQGRLTRARKELLARLGDDPELASAL